MDCLCRAMEVHRHWSLSGSVHVTLRLSVCLGATSGLVFTPRYRGSVHMWWMSGKEKSRRNGPRMCWNGVYAASWKPVGLVGSYLKQKGDWGFDHTWCSHLNGRREEDAGGGASWWWKVIWEDRECQKLGWTSALSSSWQAFWEVSGAAQSIASREKQNERLHPAVLCTGSEVHSKLPVQVLWRCKRDKSGQVTQKPCKACTLQKAILHFSTLGYTEVL